MFNISNNGIIKISRGDSASLPLFINCDIIDAENKRVISGSKILKPHRYKITTIGKEQKARVYLGVMEPNQPFERALIRQKYTPESKTNVYGDLIIKFRPEDTMYLKPGRYYYTIKIQREDRFGNEYVDTIVPQTQFFIL